jgi:glucose/mannose-6-phosphate isomerase
MKIQEYVLKNDPQNQFNVLINTYQQVESAWNNKIDLGTLKDKKFNSIIVTGLGGSAISGDLMSNFLGSELTIPFIVNRNYHLPSFADKNTLLIVSSYSGNTEETISVFNEGIRKKCSIICITTGGKIGKTALENSIPTVNVTPGFQPRYSLGLSFFSLLKILQELSIIPSQDSIVTKITSLWKEKGIQLSNEPNKAIDIARKLIGFIPVIYSAADVTSAIGYRIKCQFNENSKLHAFHNVIPELNHNEIIGWESFQDKQFNAKLILILDKTYHPQIKKRFDITASLISSEIIYLESNEEDFKSRLMDLIYLGDWISYYLALFRGFDPTEIENINILKEKLS